MAASFSPSRLLLILFPILFSTRYASAAAPIYLSDRNFTAAFPPTGVSNPKLMFFFAPWCGHCANFSPIFDEFAISRPLSGFPEMDVEFVKVDATSPESSDLASTYEVGIYPTLMYFPSSSPTAPTLPTPVRYIQDDKTAETLEIFLQRCELGNDLMLVSSQTSYDKILEIPGCDLVVTLKGGDDRGRSEALLKSVYLDVQIDELTGTLNPIFAHVVDADSKLGPDCPPSKVSARDDVAASYFISLIPRFAPC